MAQNEKKSTPTKTTTRKKKEKAVSSKLVIQIVESMLSTASVAFDNSPSREERFMLRKILAPYPELNGRITEMINFPLKEGLMDFVITSKAYAFVAHLENNRNIVLPLVIDSENPNETFLRALQWLSQFLKNEVHLLTIHYNQQTLHIFSNPEDIYLTLNGTSREDLKSISLWDLIEPEADHVVDLQATQFEVLKTYSPEFIAYAKARNDVDNFMGFLMNLMDEDDNDLEDWDEDLEEETEILPRFVINDPRSSKQDSKEKNLDSLLDRIEEGSRKKGRTKKNPKIIDVEVEDSSDSSNKTK